MGFPLPDSGLDLGSEDRKVVGILRELEHHSIYNLLYYIMGKLASGRLGAGERLFGEVREMKKDME